MEHGFICLICVYENYLSSFNDWQSRLIIARCLTFVAPFRARAVFRGLIPPCSSIPVVVQSLRYGCQFWTVSQKVEEHFFFFFFFNSKKHILITYIVLTLLTIQRLVLTLLTIQCLILTLLTIRHSIVTLLTIRRLILTLLTIQYNTVQNNTLRYLHYLF